MQPTLQPHTLIIGSPTNTSLQQQPHTTLRIDPPYQNESGVALDDGTVRLAIALNVLSCASVSEPDRLRVLSEIHRVLLKRGSTFKSGCLVVVDEMALSDGKTLASDTPVWVLAKECGFALEYLARPSDPTFSTLYRRYLRLSPAKSLAPSTYVALFRPRS